MIENSQGRLPDRRPLSIIDIIESIRLVIYEGIARSPTVLFNEKMLAGLGRGIVSTGRLDPEAVTRAVEEFRRFRALSSRPAPAGCTSSPPPPPAKAQNGMDFIHRAEDILGVPIRALSGREEAYYSALGVISGFHPADGIAGCVFGGGSLEPIRHPRRGDRRRHHPAARRPSPPGHVEELAGGRAAHRARRKTAACGPSS